VHAGRDQLDATSSHLPVPDYTQGLQSVDSLASRPLQGKRIGIIQETVGQGVSAGVNAAFDRAAKHLESLGAKVDEVQLLGILHMCHLENGEWSMPVLQ
jgi:aspartyl-tRNA(Asn)/glutamyl-tRNA(Gln) amidotransferase subunit A